MFLVSFFSNTVIKQVKERIWNKVWTRAARGIASLHNHMVYIITSPSVWGLLSKQLPRWTCDNMTTSETWELVDDLKIQLLHFNVKTANNKTQHQNLSVFSTAKTIALCPPVSYAGHCSGDSTASHKAGWWLWWTGMRLCTIPAT